MIKHRVSYWSCSGLADWVRGEKKPAALGFDEWDGWRDEVKSNRPIRYFIAEEVLDFLQDVVYFPMDAYRSVRAYLDNRFVHKTHCLKTDLEPGRFHELGDRFLHGLFNELKEFVEVDLGMMHSAWRKGEFKPRRGRCPEAGVAHLEWAMALKLDEGHGVRKKDKNYKKPTRQAVAAAEMMELYRWWESRPSRPDPAEVSGFRDLVDEKVGSKKSRAAYRRMEAIENKYRKEDDRMIVRLVRIRDDLWT